ncbi:5302_t:CDS:2 [Ambispora gerdemannii]|uniref:5302_t:CDS:1 n=1 Tax=Ambispora gerdemannii TaxID=144530 RepID=A0A9N8V3F0_9GLOM|nr:5302_t:CDS:2 [Ambispora gerdemannii]
MAEVPYNMLDEAIRDSSTKSCSEELRGISSKRKITSPMLTPKVDINSNGQVIYEKKKVTPHENQIQIFVFVLPEPPHANLTTGVGLNPERHRKINSRELMEDLKRVKVVGEAYTSKESSCCGWIHQKLGDARLKVWKRRTNKGQANFFGESHEGYVGGVTS